MEDEIGFIGDDPLDPFSFLEFHGLSDSRGEINVPLLTFFSLNDLDFGGKTHVCLLRCSI
jgi:hypothetical protein